MESSDFLFAEVGVDHLGVHFNESTFGLTEFSRVLEERFASGKKLACLEIGTGSGVLLTRLKERYPQHSWQGIEPLAQGFSRFEPWREAVAKKFSLDLHRSTFEEFETDQSFDFIFSLNVLEHMDSWRDCIAKAHGLLRAGGAAVFLCPNYSFPYEPHYALPIVLTKDLTARIFRRQITKFDEKLQSADLWTSLNFIKKREVVAFCREKGIALTFDEAILTRMVEKLWTDPEFAARQSRVAMPAKVFHRAGVTRLIERSWLSQLSPYVKIIVSK